MCIYSLSFCYPVLKKRIPIITASKLLYVDREPLVVFSTVFKKLNIVILSFRNLRHNFVANRWKETALHLSILKGLVFCFVFLFFFFHSPIMLSDYFREQKWFPIDLALCTRLPPPPSTPAPVPSSLPLRLCFPAVSWGRLFWMVKESHPAKMWLVRPSFQMTSYLLKSPVK